jgi:acyl dehydratase
MPLDPSFVGRKGARGRVVVERSAVSAFARAVKDANPIYHDAAAAKAAGFRDIPAPPTYLIAAASFGGFAELQPADPGPNPAAEVVVEYARQGGLLLHGEQSFVFERPVVVGDVLDHETEIVETYQKGSLTFTVMETRYTDGSTGELVAVGRNNIINRS